MTNARETARERSRTRRTVLKNVAIAEENARRNRLYRILGTIVDMLSSEQFVQITAVHGICYAPKALFARSNKHTSGRDGADVYAAAVLDFVAAWKFLFPLLTHPDLAEYFRMSWPGFIDDIKDTFIALVMQGPFLDERRTTLGSGAFK